MNTLETGEILTITICMGSSCYSRGNGRNLESIRAFVNARGLDAKVRLVGHLCEEQCRSGPNIRVDGELCSHVEPGGVLDAVRKRCGDD